MLNRRSLAKPLLLIAISSVLIAAVLGPACAPVASPALSPASSASSTPRGPILDFSFQALDQSVVSSASLRGRNTVIVFISSYDIASQAQVRFLSGFVRTHTPRINGIAVILEPKESAPLVLAFADALGLKFPVVHLEPRALVGGPFSAAQMVPHVVVLDREGRSVLNKQGLMDEKQLEAVLSPID